MGQERSSTLVESTGFSWLWGRSCCYIVWAGKNMSETWGIHWNSFGVSIRWQGRWTKARQSKLSVHKNEDLCWLIRQHTSQPAYLILVIFLLFQKTPLYSGIFYWEKISKYFFVFYSVSCIITKYAINSFYDALNIIYPFNK